MRISSAWTGRVKVCGCTGREVDGVNGDGGPSCRGWLYCRNVRSYTCMH